MAIVAKTFLHNDDKIVGASGDADGVLPEDVQDWITANGGTVDGTSNLSGKGGLSVAASEKLDVYGEVSFAQVDDADNTYGTKIGAKYKF